MRRRSAQQPRAAWRRLPAALFALLLQVGSGRSAHAAAALAVFKAPGPHERVLVVAPHPDDESLCCAGLLQRARSNGAAIGVVWVTAGDSFELDAMVVEHTLWPHGLGLQHLGAQRLLEARTAADELGVPRSQQYFLGYPDRGIVPLMGPYYTRTYHSRYTGLSAVPYPQALSPDASYTGANLEADLTRVLDLFRPTLVFVAAPQDQHPDHSGSGALVYQLLQRRHELGKLYYWIVHAPSWPRPRGYSPQRSLQPPASAAALQWETLPLTGAERARKLAALRDHKSQWAITGPDMRAFVRANELFAPAQ